MLNNRLAGAGGILAEMALDALIVTDIVNIRYLSGFTGSDAVLVIAAEARHLLTDSRYVTQAAQEAPDFRVTEYRGKVEGLAELFRTAGWQRAGFESEQMTFSFHAGLAPRLEGVELVPLGDALSSLRSIKDPGEVAALRRTARGASEALLAVIAALVPGRREAEVAFDLEWAMRTRGLDGRSFDFIVASGERGALPHGRATDKVIAAGELVTIDYGGILDGYCSDETVTVAVGKPAARAREIYGIVLEAHDRAIAAIRPGVAAVEVDRVARSFIEEQGYGGCFGHGLGHGIGLEVHEKPVISPRGTAVLAEGMVFTVEPGIYIPGWGGVRIEDTVVVTAAGCELLTAVPKELLVL